MNLHTNVFLLLIIIIFSKTISISIPSLLSFFDALYLILSFYLHTFLSSSFHSHLFVYTFITILLFYVAGYPLLLFLGFLPMLGGPSDASASILFGNRIATRISFQFLLLLIIIIIFLFFFSTIQTIISFFAISLRLTYSKNSLAWDLASTSSIPF